jgi:hypothetical protein
VSHVAASIDIFHPRTTDIIFTLLWTVTDIDEHCGAHTQQWTLTCSHVQLTNLWHFDENK